MRIRNLSSFVKVARLGSFRAAAAQLHVSQPAVSSRINALEEELGVSLFARDKSGTTLTKKGTKLLVYAEKVIAISIKMKEIAGQHQKKGNLKIGIADTLAHLWLTPLLEQWQQQYPNISFELTCDVTAVLAKQLSQHQIDLSLMVNDTVSEPGLVIHKMCSYRQVWVAKKGLIKQTGSLSVKALAAYSILSYPRETTPWFYLQRLLQESEAEAVVHTCSSVASLINLVEQGLGIALLPQVLVSSQLKAQSLELIECEEQPPVLEFCCSWREDEEESLPKQLAQSASRIMQDFDQSE